MRTALDHVDDLFVDGRTRPDPDAEAAADGDTPSEEIGWLTVELDFVKRIWHASTGFSGVRHLRSAG